MGYGWTGKKVRNDDGRTGEIVREDEWFAGDDLHIAVDGGGKAVVKLRSRGKDGGETGWHWWCPEFCSGARWLPLGDHNKPNAELSGPEAALSPEGRARTQGYASAVKTEEDK